MSSVDLAGMIIWGLLIAMLILVAIAWWKYVH